MYAAMATLGKAEKPISQVCSVGEPKDALFIKAERKSESKSLRCSLEFVLYRLGSSEKILIQNKGP